MKLSGNTILITGGTSGLGLGFAEEFLRLGNTVIICGRRQERLTSIKEKHPEIITYKCDVKIASEREMLFNEVKKNYPDTNVLINNAGIQHFEDFTKAVNLDKIKAQLDTNIIAPLHLISLFAEQLSSKKDAAIINITSGLAFAPLAIMPVYCATKAAFHSLTFTIRHQFKNTSVKVIEVAPPAVETELGSDNRTDSNQSHYGIPVSEFIAETMVGLREGKEEIAVGNAKNLRLKGEEMFSMMNH